MLSHSSELNAFKKQPQTIPLKTLEGKCQKYSRSIKYSTGEFYVNVTPAKVTWEEGTSIKKKKCFHTMGAAGKSVEHFLSD